MIRLTDTELTKFAEEIDIPHYVVQKIFSMGLLRERPVLMHVIRHDYKRLCGTRKYTKAQIKLALQNKYKVSSETLRFALYSTTVRQYYCEECGKRIRKAEYNRNDGLCDACVAATIEV